jgi:cytochrome c-type biogenesis protein CcmH/NrfG
MLTLFASSLSLITLGTLQFFLPSKTASLHLNAKQRFSLCCGLLLISSLVLTGYYRSGRADTIDRISYLLDHQQEIIHTLKTEHHLSDLSRRFEYYLKSHPKDGQAWHLLGKLYMRQEQWLKATNALTTAKKLGLTSPALAEAITHSNHFRKETP